MPHQSYPSSALSFKNFALAFWVFLIAAVTVLPQNAHSQVFSQKFDSKGHPKAKGVWATVRYPAGWEVKDGERPNIVQKFSGEYKGAYTILMLQIRQVDQPIEQECKNMSAREIPEAFSDSQEQIFADNARKITHEQKPGFIYDMRQKTERAGLSFEVHQRIMSVCYKKTMISLMCGPMKIDRERQKIASSKALLDEVNPVCHQFFNSLVLMDNY